MLRRPPPFRVRSSGQGPAATGGKRAEPSATATPFAAPPVFRDLKELVAQGIPSALRCAIHHPSAGVAGARSPGIGAGSAAAAAAFGSRRMGGAFMAGEEEGEQEAGFLGGVVTAIPRVEVSEDVVLIVPTQF